MILRADKSGKTAFMGPIDYEERANAMLNDTSTYVVTNDETCALQRKCNSFVSNLFKNSLNSPSKIKMIINYRF